MKRIVRVSRTASEQFGMLLIQGANMFGADVAEEKRHIVRDKLENFLAEYPHQGEADRRRKLHYFPVSRTPFVVVYEYDAAELRVLFIVPKGSDRRRLDPSNVRW